MERDEQLERLVDHISRRDPIDWEDASRSHGDVGLMEALAQIDSLARFHKQESEQSELESWGPLRILEQIGSGGFGEVYRAWDPKLNRQVALKLLHSQYAEEGVTMLEEARLLARVQSSQIVQIHGAETHDGRPGIWMEFVEGQDLASYAIERQRLEADEVAEIGVQLCRALRTLHDAGIVHQDVKLQNVMRRVDGSLVLMDLGASRRRDLQSAEQRESLRYTPRYLAPELLAGDAPSPQSDLWAVGIILHRLATGEFPYDGGLTEILEAIREGARRPVAELAPALPRAQAECIERALAPSPTERFATAQAMEAALRDAGGTRDSRQRRPMLAVLAAAAVVLAMVWIFATRSPAPLQVDARWSAIGQRVETPLDAGDSIDPEQGIRLRVRLSRPAWLYVLNRDESGSTVLLYPGRGRDEATQLPANTELLLPRTPDGQELQWTLSEDAGLESFLVIASTEKLNEFEQQLDQIAAIDLGQGIVVKPLEDLAMSTLTRGVIGARPVEDATTDREPADLFALAQRLADGPEERDGIRLELFMLRNLGDR